MTDTLVTYHSINSRPEHQWQGYIHLDGRRLDVSFFGETEEQVKEKMRAFYAKDKQVRDANRARKEAQRIAAAARAEKKKENA